MQEIDRIMEGMSLIKGLSLLIFSAHIMNLNIIQSILNYEQGHRQGLRFS